MEVSERTFAAIAALIGMARFALTSDIAARSGIGSPATLSSSSRVSLWYCSVLATFCASLRLRVALGDVSVLDRARVGGRVVAQDVERERGVHRSSDVRVDERHRGPLRQRLTRELVELLACQPVVLL